MLTIRNSNFLIFADRIAINDQSRTCLNSSTVSLFETNASKTMEICPKLVESLSLTKGFPK
jgi:hypothetical protein